MILIIFLHLHSLKKIEIIYYLLFFIINDIITTIKGQHKVPYYSIMNKTNKMHAMSNRFFKKYVFDPLAFQKIPMKDRTYHMCISAVNYDGRLLRQVPLVYIDEQMCKIALKNCDEVVLDIPHCFLTRKMQKMKNEYLKTKDCVDIANEQIFLL